jgi:hypothetical protein
MDCVPLRQPVRPRFVVFDAAAGMYAELSRINIVIDALRPGADRDAVARIASSISAQQLDLLFDWLTEAPLEAVRH